MKILEENIKLHDIDAYSLRALLILGLRFWIHKNIGFWNPNNSAAHYAGIKAVRLFSSGN